MKLLSFKRFFLVVHKKLFEKIKQKFKANKLIGLRLI